MPGAFSKVKLGCVGFNTHAVLLHPLTTGIPPQSTQTRLMHYTPKWHLGPFSGIIIATAGVRGDIQWSEFC